jgi:hypothetical protein
MRDDRLKKLLAALLALALLLAPGAGLLGQAATSSPVEARAPQTQSAPPPAGQDTATPSGGEPAEAREHRLTRSQAAELFRSVDEILQFASQDTGLPIRGRVKRKLASRDQVEQFVLRRMKDDKDTKRLQRSEVVLKKFGLLPRDFDLRTFLLGLLKEQVAGFYDARSKTVYLLDWVDAEEQKPVLAHELTHALQDQNFGLEAMEKRAGQDDPTGIEADERLAALQAVTEGQAMLVLLDYSLVPTGASVAEQPAMVGAMEAGLGSGSPNMVMFNHAPLFLQQVLLFPYRYGMRFERDVLVAGGKEKAFAGVLKNPPQDTRQILHPQTYLEGQMAPPLRPAEFAKLLPAYQQWDLSAIGEFDVTLLLRQYAGREASDRVSREWRGGYYWAALKPEAAQRNAGKRPVTAQTGDLALAYLSRWSTPEAAKDFAECYAQGVPLRYAGARRTANPTAGVDEWQTAEGPLTITVRGNEVLVLESFDAAAAARVGVAAMP